MDADSNVPTRRLAKHIQRRLVTVLTLICLTASYGHTQSAQKPPPPSFPVLSALPPVPTTPWDSAQSGWKGRLVVGEYITGVFCGPCQAHDEAFNALLKRYPSSAFVSLAYHGAGQYTPLMDPADGIALRLFKWYGFPNTRKKEDQGMFGSQKTIDNWIDGRSVDSSGTSAMIVFNALSNNARPERQYEIMSKTIDAELARPPEAFFHVEAAVRGGTVVARVRMDSVTGQHPDLFLRLALVEDTVNMASTSPVVRRHEHHMVVRNVASTKQLPLGLPLHVPDTVQYVFDVTALQHRLLREYKNGLAVAQLGNKSDSLLPAEARGTPEADEFRLMITSFPKEQNWTIDQKRLHVVAFVQDAHSGEVLQSAMVKVNTGAAGKH